MKDQEEKVHIHKAAQMHNCSIQTTLEKYGEFRDEKGMIPKSVLNKCKL